MSTTPAEGYPPSSLWSDPRVGRAVTALVDYLQRQHASFPRIEPWKDEEISALVVAGFEVGKEHREPLPFTMDPAPKARTFPTPVAILPNGKVVMSDGSTWVTAPSGRWLERPPIPGTERASTWSDKDEEAHGPVGLG